MVEDQLEQARRVVQTIETKINGLTAGVAEESVKQTTTPEQMAGMEHLLVCFESLLTGYHEVLEAFEAERPERAFALFDQLETFRAQLFQKLEPSGPPTA